jgi:hypothetical protein
MLIYSFIFLMVSAISVLGVPTMSGRTELQLFLQQIRLEALRICRQRCVKATSIEEANTALAIAERANQLLHDLVFVEQVEEPGAIRMQRWKGV